MPVAHRTNARVVPEAQAREHFAKQNTVSIKGHRSAVRTVAWNSNGSRLASGSTDRTIRIWNIDKPDICWDPCHSDRLASVSADRTMRLWDYRSGRTIFDTKTGGENLYVTWSPDGRYIAIGSRDDVVTFVDTLERKVVKQIKEPVEVNESKWSNSGRFWYLTTGTGLVKVFTWPELDLIYSIDAHTSNCFCLDVDPFGRYLAVGGADALVSIWDSKELVCEKTLPRLNFDGAYIASASEDRFIDIANVESTEEVRRISVNHAINTVAWHPSQYYLAYAGEDYGGTLNIFGLK